MVQLMSPFQDGQAPMRQEPACSLAQRVTYLRKIRERTVRETLQVILSLACQLRRDFYILQTTNKELAELLEVTPRTVQNRLNELRALDLKELQIRHDDHGQIIEIDLSGYYNGGEIGGEVPHEIGGEAQNDGGVKYPTKHPTKSQVGTVPATCTGVTIPPSDTTYPSEEVVAATREREATTSTSSDSDLDLKQFIRAKVRSAGWMAPTDMNLDEIEKELLGSLKTDEARRAFVTQRLSDLQGRKADGERIGNALMLRCLREDCYGWVPASEQPQRVQVESSTGSGNKATAPKPASRPSNSYTSEGHEERFARAVEYGTRNLDKLEVDMTEHKARQAKAELDAMWGSLIDIGVAKHGDPIDEAKLREYGIHPDQRDWGVLG